MRVLRALSALGLVAASVVACTLTLDTEGLTGGTPADSGFDTAACETGTCTNELLVVKQADLAPCGPSSTDVLGCRKKIHDLCVARNPCCSVGGFGPVEYPNATEATIVCLAGKAYTAPSTEVLGGACTTANLGSRTCDAAVHLAAKKRGFATGILQTVAADQTMTIVGIGAPDCYPNPGVPWGDLTKLDSKCTLATIESQACTSAVHRWCSSDIIALQTGFGPVVVATTDVVVICLY